MPVRITIIYSIQDGWAYSTWTDMADLWVLPYFNQMQTDVMIETARKILWARLLGRINAASNKLVR